MSRKLRGRELQRRQYERRESAHIRAFSTRALATRVILLLKYSRLQFLIRAKERLLAVRWILSQSTIFGENTVYCLEGSRQFVKKVTLVR